VSGTVAVACAPAPGSTFAIGTTLITCSSRDAAGNTATGRFSVTVLGPRQILSTLVTAVVSDGFQQGVGLLQNAIASVNRGNTAAACGQAAAFVNQVIAQTGNKLTIDQANRLLQLARDLEAALGCR
jgi:HYR domain-containing protein